MFNEKTNEDHLQELKELGDPQELAQGYMRVATENQAVVAWFAKLDESDDPPVYHNNDEWDDDLSKINWELIAKTFTNFIYDMLSQYHFRGWHTGARLEGPASISDESTIKHCAASTRKARRRIIRTRVCGGFSTLAARSDCRQYAGTSIQ